MNRIAQIIRQMRENRGWSQADLADRAGLGRSALGNYDKGTRNPSLDVLEQLAEAFGVTMGDLVNGTELATDTDDAREDLRNDPDRKTLLNLARYGSAKDVKQVAALIDALRATNPDFYDGDDPA